MYEMSIDDRIKLSQKSLQHAKREYNYEDMIKQWDISLSLLMQNYCSNNVWQQIEL
jgi:hypothetical protein